MIINPVEKQTKNGSVSIEASVELDHPTVGIPSKIWINYPEALSGNITQTHNPFVPSLAVLASFLGEDLEVRGSLSRRLLWGVNQVINVFMDWSPKVFHPIRIFPDSLTDAHIVSDETAILFSGGVDSYYSLLNHNPETDKILPVSSAIFVHGCDIPLDKPESYARVFDIYEPILVEMGIRLISAKTNMREFHRKVNWNITYGSVLAGIAFGMEGLYRQLLFSAQHQRDAQVMQGSEIRLVSSLSTENTEVLLDGQIHRAEKVAYLCQQPVTYSTLRVCWEHPDGIMNCGKCEKCIRTMVELELAGGLKDYKTFKSKLHISQIVWTNINSPVKRAFWYGCFQEAYHKKRIAIIVAISLAFIISWLRKVLLIDKFRTHFTRVKGRVNRKRYG